MVSSNASLSYDAVVRHLADGVAVLPQGADPGAPEYISDFDGHDTAEVQRFGQHDLLDHAAFVVQQVGPVLGRHALKVRCNYSFLMSVIMQPLMLKLAKLQCSYECHHAAIDVETSKAVCQRLILPIVN